VSFAASFAARPRRRVPYGQSEGDLDAQTDRADNEQTERRRRKVKFLGRAPTQYGSGARSGLPRRQRTPTVRSCRSLARRRRSWASLEGRQKYHFTMAKHFKKQRFSFQRVLHEVGKEGLGPRAHLTSDSVCGAFSVHKQAHAWKRKILRGL
jgi:hypothetical protein